LPRVKQPPLLTWRRSCRLLGCPLQSSKQSCHRHPAGHPFPRFVLLVLLHFYLSLTHRVAAIQLSSLPALTHMFKSTLPVSVTRLCADGVPLLSQKCFCTCSLCPPPPHCTCGTPRVCCTAFTSCQPCLQLLLPGLPSHTVLLPHPAAVPPPHTHKQDPAGLLHRLDKLSALLASRQAALDMLLTHPQVRRHRKGSGSSSSSCSEQ
jgi:hypothetical protein